MRVCKIYKNDMQKEEGDAAHFQMGYHIVWEEEIKVWSPWKTIILGLIFLPLALFGRVKRRKVVYESN